MARAPFVVLVYPYIQLGDSDFNYALFRRADEGWWQGVAGGGEDEETPLAAARRETREESGITSEHFLRLDTMFFVKATYFSVSHLWGDDVYVIPMYCYGVRVEEPTIKLSHEHTEFRWLNYTEAEKLVRYDGNKTALWELNRRVRGCGPRGEC